MKTKIGIVQLTDIHWSYTSADLAKKGYIEGQVTGYASLNENFLKDLRSAVEKSAESCEKIFLLLGGDNFYAANYELGVVECMYEHLLGPVLNFKKPNGDYIFDGVFAVPGNHDIFDNKRRKQPKGGEKAIRLIGDPDDGELKPNPTTESTTGGNADSNKFYRFCCWLDYVKQMAPSEIEVYSPFAPEPTVSIPIAGGTKTIRFWLANSATACGSLDAIEKEFTQLQSAIERECNKDPILYARLRENFSNASLKSHDPGYVSPEDMDKCKESLRSTDTIRVAFLHHNNLPAHNDDGQKYRFLNPGAFNNFLLDNKFRILLHGHQHVGEIASYSKFQPKEDLPYYSYAEHGFLAISSPAFDIGNHNTDEQGFNIVELEIDSEHHICAVSVDRKKMRKGQPWEDSNTRHDIVYKSVTETKRLTCYRDFNRIIFSEASMRGITRGLDSHDNNASYASELREKVKDFEDLNAAYIFSVFRPNFWLGSKMQEFLLPLGRKNIKLACERAAREPSVGKENSLLFTFSRPLTHAIVSASANSTLAQVGDISELLSKIDEIKYDQGRDFITKKIENQIGNNLCMSSFGVINGAKAAGSQFLDPLQKTDIVIKRGDHVPINSYASYNEADVKTIQALCEFPRIVSWDYEDFKRPSTLDIIELHENLAFPLFWIDRKFLRSADGKFKRKPVGYWSAIRFEMGTDENQSPYTFAHDEFGGNLSSGDIVTHAWNAKSLDLWPLQHDEMGLHSRRFSKLSRADTALDEFLWMLGHPCICFAADAWAVANHSRYSFEDLLKSLSKKYFPGGTI